MTRQAELSRRQFLRLSAATVGGATLLTYLPQSAAASAVGDPDGVPALLIDVSRCIGCGNCQRACIEANQLEPSDAQLDCLSAETFTYVQRYDLEGGETRFVKRQCLQCLHPACVSACTVGALQQTAEGVVVCDTDRCIGCRYCQYACPLSIPKFEWQNTLGVVQKCNFCLDRLRAGQAPACGSNCPSGALKFGKRGDLLREAYGRLAAAPDHYVDHIYGEHEAGGTSRLYVSDVPFGQLGFPELGSQPVPQYAEAAMRQTPTVALSVAALATGLYTIMKRRESQAEMRMSGNSKEDE